MAYKMKGHSLPGIKQKAKSPAKKSASPAKCPLLAMAPAIMGAVGAMKKGKEE